jgi:3-dehydroquinate dehydratase-2
MTKKITVINGANLNMLGKREPEIYGKLSFEDFFEGLKKQFHNVELEYYQSNIEGEIINFIHMAGQGSSGIILNAGGYSHTSVAIADAVKSVDVPCIEVHISNLFTREEIRRTSLISAYAKGSIIGLGLDGYRLAVEHFLGTDEQ